MRARTNGGKTRSSGVPLRSNPLGIGKVSIGCGAGTRSNWQFNTIGVDRCGGHRARILLFRLTLLDSSARCLWLDLVSTRLEDWPSAPPCACIKGCAADGGRACIYKVYGISFPLSDGQAAAIVASPPSSSLLSQL